MVKFGIHAGLWMDQWTDDPSLVFAKVVDMGFDGVELSLLGIDIKRAETIRKTAQSHGLSITCSTGLGAGHDPSSANPSERALGKQTLYHAIEITAALGSFSLAGVVASPWGQFDPRNINDRMQQASETLGSLQDHLKTHNVTLGIEALNRFEGDLTCTAQQTIAIARNSGAANVGILLDTFHMNIEEKHPAQMLRHAGDTLCHYHISGHDRGVPYDGRYDYTADAAALKSIGYDGWIVAEMFVRAGVPTSADLNIWHPIEPDADRAARQALDFMKRVYL